MFCREKYLYISPFASVPEQRTTKNMDSIIYRWIEESSEASQPATPPNDSSSKQPSIPPAASTKQQSSSAIANPTSSPLPSFPSADQSTPAITLASSGPSVPSQPFLTPEALSSPQDFPAASPLKMLFMNRGRCLLCACAAGKFEFSIDCTDLRNLQCCNCQHPLQDHEESENTPGVTEPIHQGSPGRAHSHSSIPASNSMESVQLH
jgi:hypothetical protein